MTARPLRRSPTDESLRVIKGRQRRSPSMAPWMIMVLIAVVAFLGLGFARTSLDKSAFEIQELNRVISEQVSMNQQLNLEIARLENPARIAPLAEELGLVIPQNTRQLIVDLTPGSSSIAGAENQGDTQ